MRHANSYSVAKASDEEIFVKRVNLVLMGFGQDYALGKLKVVPKLNPHSMQLKELITQMNN